MVAWDSPNTMWITSARIANYKCFRETPDLQFGRGLNVIVGKNNAGKSALLEALKLPSLGAAPHRSAETVSRPGAPPSIPDSTFEYLVEFEHEEAVGPLAAAGRFIFSGAGGEIALELARFEAELQSPCVLRAKIVNGAITEGWFVSDDQRNGQSGLPPIGTGRRSTSMRFR